MNIIFVNILNNDTTMSMSLSKAFNYEFLIMTRSTTIFLFISVDPKQLASF